MTQPRRGPVGGLGIMVDRSLEGGGGCGEYLEGGEGLG
jgi:hypothetical protein